MLSTGSIAVLSSGRKWNIKVSNTVKCILFVNRLLIGDKSKAIEDEGDNWKEIRCSPYLGSSGLEPGWKSLEIQIYT